MSTELIARLIRDIPDFPKPGIVFKDITPVFQDPAGLRAAVDLFAERWEGRGVQRIVGIESRGFLLCSAVAARLGVGCGLIRKKGKLPWRTISRSYDLEYGSATVEAHTDMVQPGMRVAVVDDLLATGGTAEAAVGLCRELGATVVEVGFLIELGFLPGRKRLLDAGVEVFTAIVV